jgi:hypothetical protein
MNKDKYNYVKFYLIVINSAYTSSISVIVNPNLNSLLKDTIIILIGCTPGIICSLIFIHKLKKSESKNDIE